MWFHVDSGANVFAVKDKSLLFYFVSQRLPYKDVNGNVNFSEGFGIALVRFTGSTSVYPIGPVYVNASAPRNTFSLSALLRFGGFQDASEHMMKCCSFHDFQDKQWKIPCSHHNGLDFIDLEILMVDPVRVAAHPPASLNILTQQSRRQLSAIERLQEAHLRLGHPSFDSLVYMSKKGLLKDLPPLPHVMPIICKACFHHNRTRLPKNPPDHSRPPIMARISCDFTFYSTLSLRGHNSAFTLVDQATRYPFAFPCCAKRPPISIIKFFIGCIRNMGFNQLFLKWMKVANFANQRNFVLL